jgi:hypothetical protein
LVKPEPLKKNASVPKRPDYTPTFDFMENVLKLCAGLRTQGLVKEASELESNYLNYKQAQTLYETHKETGEDLLHTAHPEGSHKMKDVEGDAVVEDLLEKHMKHIQMVEKKPTGKLDSTASVISAVKKALGEEQKLEDWTDEDIAKDWAQFPAKWKNYVVQKMLDMTWAAYSQGSSALAPAHTFAKQGHLDMDIVSDIGTEMQQANNAQREMRSAKEVTVEGLNKMITAFKRAQNVANSKIDDETTKNAVVNGIAGAIGATSNLIPAVQAWVADQSKLPPGIPKPKKPASSVITIPATEIKEGPLGVVYRQINSYKAQLNTWSTYRSISGDPQAAQWIKEEIASLDDIANRMDKVPDNEAAEKEAVGNFQREIAEEAKSIAEFKAGWVDQK